MFFQDELNQYNNKNIKLFVDMDGVVADYDVGKAFGYKEKRPLLTSIAKLETISKQPNVELYILSITKKTEGIEEKNYWLDKFAPFFKKENRIIISKEMNQGFSSAELKTNYLKSFKRDGSILVLIDDDPSIIKKVREENEDIIIYKDSALVD